MFLDTSIIIDYLQNPERHAKNPTVQQRIIRTQSLIDHISSLDEQGNPQCFFYVSAITLAELTKFTRPDNIAQEVAQIFNTANVVFVDFSRSVANLLQRSLQNYLPDGQKHQFLSSLEQALKVGNVMNARQWVSDDLKIAASASSVKRLDAVLTADRRTFFPIAEKLEIPCMVTDSIPLDMFNNISFDANP